MWELSTETNRIETVVVRYGVATIFATVENEEESIAKRRKETSRRRFIAMNWLRSVFRQYNAPVSLRQLAIPNSERCVHYDFLREN